jgi:hypothetical protein
MRDLWSDLSDREIWQVLLPGTHNSGVFSALNTIGVRTQDRRIGEQLADGIRSFDIRVTQKNDDTYVMHHSGSYPPNSSQDLDPALDEMAAFVDAHESEIFIVRLSAGYGSNIVPDGYPALRKKVLDKLSGTLVPWSSTDSYKLSEIKAKDRNIILISSVGKETGSDDLFWSDSTDFLKDTWGEYQSECGPTPRKKLDWLKPHLEDALRNPPARFLYASCMIWTINLHDAAQEWTNPEVCSWLGSWSLEPGLRGGMNIFAVDYYNVWDSQVVNTVVALNRGSRRVSIRRQADAARAESPGAPNPVAIDMPHFRDEQSFEVANVQRILESLGLRWSSFEREFQATGTLGDEAIATLENVGIPERVTREFLKWYTQTQLGSPAELDTGTLSTV